MAAQGFKKSEYASLLGMFGGQYSTLINVPLSVSTALAASLIPSLVATIQTGNRRQVHNKINMVTRFNMILAIPCAAGFIVLGKPILDLLFFTQDNTKAALMLQMGAISVVFFCLSTVTNSVLQGLDDMMTPVKNAAISLAIHIAALFLMLVVFKWNIYAVVLSKIVFSGAICILNAHALRERIGYVQEQKKTFLISNIGSFDYVGDYDCDTSVGRTVHWRNCGNDYCIAYSSSFLRGGAGTFGWRYRRRDSWTSKRCDAGHLASKSTSNSR